MLPTTTPFETTLSALTSGTPNPEDLQTLSTSSRESEEARSRLAAPEVLKALIAAIPQDPKDWNESLDPTLRCIGNACAENDEARDAITSLGFTWARTCLRHGSDEIQALIAKVLFNICSDHEASQQQCYRDAIHLDLINFIYCDYAVFQPESSSPAIDLLFWTSGHKATIEPQIAELWPREVLSNLLDLPELYKIADMEDFTSILECVLCFVRDSVIQKQIITDDLFPIFVEKRIRPFFDKIKEKNPDDDGDAGDLKLLMPLATSLVWCLSDIAARPEFPAAYPLEHPTIKWLIKCFDARKTSFWEGIGLSSHNIQTQDIMLTAVCQIIGNLIWQLPPDSYGYLVEEERLHLALFEEISRCFEVPDSADAIHSMVGLLIHLTRPSTQIRERMADDTRLSSCVLQELCRHKIKQIKEDGAALLRALGKDSPKNQKMFASLASEVMLSLMEEQKKAADAESG